MDDDDWAFLGHEPNTAELRRLLATLDPDDETGLHIRLLLTRLLPESEYAEAIGHGEAALAGAGTDFALQFDLRCELPSRYEQRWESTGSIADLGRAIDHLNELAPFFDWAPPLTMLGRLLLTRNEAQRSKDDVEAAVKWLRAAQTMPEAGHETQAFLGIALQLQDEGEREALPLLRGLLVSNELDEPLLDLVTNRLARLHFKQHVTSPASLAKLAELDTAIQHARSGDQDDLEQVFDLAQMLGRRFSISEDESDRREAIVLLEGLPAEAMSEFGAELCADELSELYVTYCRNGGPADMATAICKLEALKDRGRDESQLVRLALAEAYSIRRSARQKDVERLLELLGELPDKDALIPSWQALAQAELVLTGRLVDGDPADVTARLWQTARASVGDHKTLVTLLVAGSHVLARRHGLHTGSWSPLGAMPDFDAVTGPRELARMRGWADALPEGIAERDELLASMTILRSHLCGQVSGPDAVEELDEQQATIEELSKFAVLLRPRDPLRLALRLQLALQRMNRAAVLGDPPGLEKVLRSLEKLLADCPRGHPLVPLVKVLLGTALLHRHNQFELPVDLRGIRELLLTADPGDQLDEPIWALSRFTLARTEVLLGAQTCDQDVLNRGVLRHREILDRLALGDTGRHDAVCGLAWSLLIRYLTAGDAADLRAATEHLRDVRSMPRSANAIYESHDLEKLGVMIDLLGGPDQALEDEFGLGELLSPDAATSAGATAALARLRGVATGFGPYPEAFRTYLEVIESLRTSNLTAVREAVQKLKTAAGEEVAEWQTGAVITTMASMTALAVHRMSGDPAALDEAVELLEKSLADGLLEVPVALGRIEPLLEAWWLRGTDADIEAAVSTGQSILRRYARQILIQRDLADCASLAATAAATAVDWARRCVEQNRLEAAFTMLEIGRTLRLHAATNLPAALREPVTSVATPSQVRANAIAGAEASAIAGGRITIPDDVRRRALDSGDPHEIAPWPPDPVAGEVARALRDLGIDFLVYLVPGAADTVGRAVHLSCTGELGSLDLPDLGPAEQGPGEIGDSCEWAWQAAMGRLSAHLSGARRIALVPCGNLGRVPWHAAREPVSGRFLLERLQVTYASSARQLGEAARRPPLPEEAGTTFVADAVDAGIGEQEASYLAALHPRGRFFGHSSWPGTTPVSRAVLADVLLGAHRPAVLHLACHAVAAADPVDARIGSGTSAVSVLELLRSAARLPEHAPGGLVVAAACETDLGGSSDEGLSVATALLATGASSVIGTKWRVSTHQTAVLMCHFHRELHSGRSPSEALHATQLWAIDPHRPPLEGLPAELATTAASATLCEPRFWAAFTHHGR